MGGVEGLDAGNAITVQEVSTTSLGHGASEWTDAKRQQFANDPDELLAVSGQASEDKPDSPPGEWMPPNTGFDCGYATHWVTVLRKYGLPIDPASVPVVRRSCP